jgi:hypothetical protein
MAVDADGNVFVLGEFDDAIQVGTELLAAPSGWGLFVAKLDPSDNVTWVRQLGDQASQWISAIALDAAGDVILAGTFEGTTVDFGAGPIGPPSNTDAFLAKLSGAQGAPEWQRHLGAANSELALAVASGPEGRIAVGGFFSGPFDMGNGCLVESINGGDFNAFVARFDADGTCERVVGYGDGAFQDVISVAIADDGGIAFSGVFEGAMAFGGDVGTLTPQSAKDAFVAKLGADGEAQYAHALAPDAAMFVRTASSGEVLLSGGASGKLYIDPTQSYAAGLDIAVCKLHASGGLAWARLLGGPGDERAVAAIAPAGQAYLAGSYDQPFAFGSTQLQGAGDLDGFAAVVGADGTPAAAISFGDGAAQAAIAIESVPTGIVVGGNFAGSLSVGGSQVDSQGALDIFVTRISPFPPE